MNKGLILWLTMAFLQGLNIKPRESGWSMSNSHSGLFEYNSFVIILAAS